MYFEIEPLSDIEQARLAMRLAEEQMRRAVNDLIKAKGCTVAQAVLRLGVEYRLHGRIKAIKYARKAWHLDLLHAKCVIDSLAARYGAHFTLPQKGAA